MFLFLSNFGGMKGIQSRNDPQLKTEEQPKAEKYHESDKQPNTVEQSRIYE